MTDQLVVVFAQHKGDELSADAAIAVFSTEGTPVFAYQSGQIGHQVAEDLHITGIFQVQQRSEMNLSGGDMGVIDAGKAVFFKDHFEFRDIIGKKFRMHGGILESWHSFSFTRNVGQHPQSGRAQSPHLFDGVGACDQRKGVAQSGLLHVADHGIAGVQQFLFGVKSQLDHQDGPGVSFHEETVFALFNILLGALQDDVVHQLHRPWLVLQCDQVGLERLLEGAEMGADQSHMFGRQRNEVYLDALHEDQGSLGAGQQFAEVERLASRGEEFAVEEYIDGVTHVAAGHPRIGEILPDGRLVDRIGEDFADIAVYLGFQKGGVPFAFGAEGLFGEGAEGHL